MATDAQQACFEAGIKFGSLYHQFAGTPVSPSSARSLESAMAEAIENQPYCEAVDVTIHDDRVADAIDHENGYTELTGSLMDVEMRIDYEGVAVQTRMEMEDGYPLMKLVAVADDGPSRSGDAAPSPDADPNA
ncbi:dihydroneopterin aldolase family protein [Halorubrum sp. AS12]|uniref:dihydroneopterin aldolase family protein n=1 Tax=Halorubrum sp. AS12 TaxID=3409687 RepID=UPI003DA79858